MLLCHTLYLALVGAVSEGRPTSSANSTTTAAICLNFQIPSGMHNRRSSHPSRGSDHLFCGKERPRIQVCSTHQSANNPCLNKKPAAIICREKHIASNSRALPRFDWFLREHEERAWKQNESYAKVLSAVAHKFFASGHHLRFALTCQAHRIFVVHSPALFRSFSPIPHSPISQHALD